MSEKITARPHTVTLEECKKATLTGVSEVLSYGEDELCIATSQGNLTVKGKNLKIIRFNTEEGALSFGGEVSLIKYASAKTPLLKRLFK